MKLAPQLRKILLESLLDALPSTEDINRLVLLHLAEAGTALTSSNLQAKYLGLITWCEAHDKVIGLLDAAIEEVPTNALLQSARALIVRSVAPPLVSSANLTLKSPDKVEVILPYADKAMTVALEHTKVALESIQNRIRLVRTYKAIHDLLHEIQKDCYEPLVDEIEASIGDSLPALEVHYEAFALRVAQLEQIASAASARSGGFEWITGRVIPLSEEWRCALEKSTLVDVKRLEKKLSQILAVYPSQIDSMLFRTAADILPEFIETLSRIELALPTEYLKNRRRFSEELSRLEALQGHLSALLLCHQRLQTLDSEIRRIGGVLPENVDELELCWPEIRKLSDLVSASEEVWANGLRQLCNRLERAINEKESCEITMVFDRFRRFAGDVFFAVDKHLKMQCEDVPDVAFALHTLLQPSWR